MSLPHFFFLSTNGLKPRECIKHGGLGTFQVYSHGPDTEIKGKVTLGETQSQKKEAEECTGISNIEECTGANAPDHWLAVEPILHLETTEFVMG